MKTKTLILSPVLVLSLVKPGWRWRMAASSWRAGCWAVGSRIPPSGAQPCGLHWASRWWGLSPVGTSLGARLLAWRKLPRRRL
jgi:hypothetical protein